MVRLGLTAKIFLSYLIIGLVILLIFRLQGLFLSTILISSVLSLLIAFILSSSIRKPISSITQTAEEIARGALGSRVSVSSKDEIGRLALSFNRMAEELQSRIETTTKERDLSQTVLHNIADSIFVVDIESKIILTNPHFEKLFARVIGKYYYEVIRNEDVTSLLESILIDGVEKSKETSLHLPTERVFHIYTAPIKDGNKVMGACTVLRDITEVKRLEKTRIDFVANVSHELKTPLTAIQGAIETLKRKDVEEISAGEFTDIIERQTERLANLISDLLDLSGIESKERKMEFEKSDLGALIERISLNFTKKAEKKSQRFNISLPKESIIIEINAERIEQAIANLIDNAIKFTQSGGEVTVSLSASEELIKIEVVDTGPGIPADDIPRIFERFYRVDKARSRELGGTGLGLSIAKHIVEAHNGRIEVESEFDKGSKFIIILPKKIS